MLHNHVGYCTTYIRRPGVEDDYLDIIDRIALLSKPARDLFVAMKNNKSRDYNTVVLQLRDTSKTKKCRYSRLCTELKKAGLILKVRNSPDIIMGASPYTYMLNPFLIPAYEDVAFALWVDLGGEEPNNYS